MFEQERGIYDRIEVILNKNEIKTSPALRYSKKKARSEKRKNTHKQGNVTIYGHKSANRKRRTISDKNH